MTTYRVTRNCCTSGNCVTCMNRTPYGTPVRVEQASYPDKKRAEQVRRGWQDYKAEVEEVES